MVLAGPDGCPKWRAGTSGYSQARYFSVASEDIPFIRDTYPDLIEIPPKWIDYEAPSSVPELALDWMLPEPAPPPPPQPVYLPVSKNVRQLVVSAAPEHRPVPKNPRQSITAGNYYRGAVDDTASHRQATALAYLTFAELDFLRSLACSFAHAPVAVNIGAGTGTSALALLESRPDLRLYTIDISAHENPYGGLFNERFALEKYGLWNPERHTQIHGDSKRVGKEWTGGAVDLVFIDGDHSYKGCTGDIRAWLPHVKPDGIVAIHDYGKEEFFSRPVVPKIAPHPANLPDVDRATDKMMSRYPLILRVHTLIAFRIARRRGAGK